MSLIRRKRKIKTTVKRTEKIDINKVRDELFSSEILKENNLQIN